MERDNGGTNGKRSQGTHIKDPWTKTMGRAGLNRGGGEGGRVMGRKWGEL